MNERMVWVLFCLYGAVALLRDVCSLIAPRKTAATPSAIADAKKLLETPRPVSDGPEFVKYECREVFCDNPDTQGAPPKIVVPKRRTS